MPDINAFRNLAGSEAMGRVKIGGDDAPESKASSKLGKIFTEVRDFFKRANTSVATKQANHNTEARQALETAIRDRYGDGVADEISQKLTVGKDGQPLNVRDVRSVLQSAERAEIRQQNLQDLALGVSYFNGEDYVQLELSEHHFSRETLETVPNLRQVIEGKVAEGADIVNALIKNEVEYHNSDGQPVALTGNDGAIRPSTHEEVNNVCWFMHLLAENKNGGEFNSGAVTITDPGGRIKSFLDGCDQAYQRESSHTKEFQAMDGGTHRGIDFSNTADDPNTIVPHGRATLLYGGLSASDDLAMPEDMLFFKLESHGCRLSEFLPGVHKDPEGPEGRRINLWADIKQFVGHSLSFLSGMGARATGDHGADSRKERIDGSVKEAYQAIVDALPDQEDVLMAHDPLSTSGGIRVMIENLNNLNIIDMTPEQDRMVADFIGELEDKYGDEGDTMHLRIGNEVIISQDDFPDV